MTDQPAQMELDLQLMQSLSGALVERLRNHPHFEVATTLLRARDTLYQDPTEPTALTNINEALANLNSTTLPTKKPASPTPEPAKETPSEDENAGVAPKKTPPPAETPAEPEADEAEKAAVDAAVDSPAETHAALPTLDATDLENFSSLKPSDSELDTYVKNLNALVVFQITQILTRHNEAMQQLENIKISYRQELDRIVAEHESELAVNPATDTDTGLGATSDDDNEEDGFDEDEEEDLDEEEELNGYETVTSGGEEVENKVPEPKNRERTRRGSQATQSKASQEVIAGACDTMIPSNNVDASDSTVNTFERKRRASSGSTKTNVTPKAATTSIEETQWRRRGRSASSQSTNSAKHNKSNTVPEVPLSPINVSASKSKNANASSSKQPPSKRQKRQPTSTSTPTQRSSSLRTPRRTRSASRANSELVDEDYAAVDGEDQSATSDQRQQRYRSNHPPWVGSFLKRWLFTHLNDPHPSNTEKEMLARKTGLTRPQISDWLVNARRRILPKATPAMMDRFINMTFDFDTE